MSNSTNTESRTPMIIAIIVLVVALVALAVIYVLPARTVPPTATPQVAEMTLTP